MQSEYNSSNGNGTNKNKMKKCLGQANLHTANEQDTFILRFFLNSINRTRPTYKQQQNWHTRTQMQRTSRRDDDNGVVVQCNANFQKEKMLLKYCNANVQKSKERH